MSAPMHASIVAHFQDLEDPRIDRAKKHNLLDIIIIAVCTLLTGGEGFRDMELFGQSKHRWLKTFLALPHGIPSHDTFGRVFARLNPQRFHACFLSWTQSVAALTHGALVSLDGKTVKASFDRATAASPLHMLSAWCSHNGGLVIGQLKTDSKSNEITAIPALLQLLAINGCLVTIDAMGCQTHIAAQILDQGGDYLLTLKSNHKKAYTAVTQHFHEHIEPNLSWRDDRNFFDAFDDSHGRIVRRRVWTMTDLEPLPALTKWPSLHAVIAVETIRTAHQHTPVTSDYRFFITSLVRSAEACATMIRQHWDVENTLHWSLDVTFNEDRSRIRKEHAPENMAALRRLALNLLRQEQSHMVSLRQKRLLCSLDEHYLLTVLSGAT
jgi:predicted transposase YbfD/YdcC